MWQCLTERPRKLPWRGDNCATDWAAQKSGGSTVDPGLHAGGKAKDGEDPHGTARVIWEGCLKQNREECLALSRKSWRKMSRLTGSTCAPSRTIPVAFSSTWVTLCNQILGAILFPAPPTPGRNRSFRIFFLVSELHHQNTVPMTADCAAREAAGPDSSGKLRQQIQDKAFLRYLFSFLIACRKI